jgi:hypothetical protein
MFGTVGGQSIIYVLKKGEPREERLTPGAPLIAPK